MTEPALQLAQVIADLNAVWTPHDGQHPVIYAAFGLQEPVIFDESGRKKGKSEEIAYFLWRMSLTRRPNLGHYYFAPEQKQAKEIFWAANRIQTFGPGKYIADINNSEMRIRMVNGAFIKIDGSDNYNAYRGLSEVGSAVYDEYRDFRREFHNAFGPNLAVHNAPLLICSTPPEAPEGSEAAEHYDSMKAGLVPGRSYFSFPSWINPYLSKEWLRNERAKHIARGEYDVWQREYEAKRVMGGNNAIFPMFSRQRHVRPHDELLAEVLRDRTRLEWQVVCDPGNASVFGVLVRAINPYTRKVYVLGEIYEKDQAETSTSRIIPRIKAMRDELCPGWQLHGIEWTQVYDEAATWFMTEAANSFEEFFAPTQKALNDKDQGLSLIKDQMLADLFVVSDRCPNLIKEIKGYIRDKKGKIPKESDHLIDCLTGSQRVHTSRGLVPIARVRAGDLVMTRAGWKPVIAQWGVGKRPVLRLHFSNGHTLDCTPEHLVFTSNRGFTKAEDLKPEDHLIGGNPWLAANPSSSTESPFGGIPTQSVDLTASISAPRRAFTNAEFASFMSRLGRRPTVPFLKGITFITKTAIRSITRSITSNASQLENIITSIISASLRRPSEQTSTASGHSPQRGTARQRAGLGIASTAGRGLWRSPCKPSPAAPAPKPFEAALPWLGSALEPVRLVRIEPRGESRVYDLMVAGEPEFFAESVLVHNCSRYGNAAAGCDLTPVPEPLKPDPDTQRRGYSMDEDLLADSDEIELEY